MITSVKKTAACLLAAVTVTAAFTATPITLNNSTTIVSEASAAKSKPVKLKFTRTATLKVKKAAKRTRKITVQLTAANPKLGSATIYRSKTKKEKWIKVKTVRVTSFKKIKIKKSAKYKVTFHKTGSYPAASTKAFTSKKNRVLKVKKTKTVSLNFKPINIWPTTPKTKPTKTAAPKVSFSTVNYTTEVSLPAFSSKNTASAKKEVRYRKSTETWVAASADHWATSYSSAKINATGIWEFQTRNCNSVGCAAWSPSTKITVATPATPKGLKLSKKAAVTNWTTTKPEVSWTPHPSNGWSSTVSYELQYRYRSSSNKLSSYITVKPENGMFGSPASAHTLTLGNTGHIYYVRIRVKTPIGYSAYTSEIPVLMYKKPSASLLGSPKGKDLQVKLGTLGSGVTAKVTAKFTKTFMGTPNTTKTCKISSGTTWKCTSGVSSYATLESPKWAYTTTLTAAGQSIVYSDTLTGS